MSAKTVLQSVSPSGASSGDVAPPAAPGLEPLVPAPSAGVNVADGTPTPTPPANDDGANDAQDDTDQRPPPQEDPPYTGGPDDAPYGYKADGTPRKSKAGRPPANAAAAAERAKQHARLKSVTPSTHKPTKAAPIQVPALAVVNYQAMGETAASLFFNVPAMVLGDEWHPEPGSGEPEAVAGAFRDYFKASNVRDIPPGFALCLVLSVYGIKRMQKPTIGQKLKGVGAWLKANIKIKR